MMMTVIMMFEINLTAECDNVPSFMPGALQSRLSFVVRVFPFTASRTPNRSMGAMRMKD